MDSYDYLIIGAGMTAHAAAKGIRELDAAGSIGMIGAEEAPPYNRPPLTKGLWKGKPEDSIWRELEGLEVELMLGRRVQALDLAHNIISDAAGRPYTYAKLLLATGGTPRRLPFGEDDILYYRTFGDYKRLRELNEAAGRIAVVGGGFIGSEIAAALAMNDQQVSMIFPGNAIAERLFPPEISQFLNDYYRARGVEVLAGEMLTGLERDGERLRLKMESGRTIEAGGVVAGIGIRPNVELAQQAGLEVDDGIVVDERLRAGRDDVFAAGDVASFYNPLLGKRLRVEHEDNANSMGRAAGRSMAGDEAAYDYLPYFYSDLFELGYEAVGELDSRLQTVIDWQAPFDKGVIYYLDGGRVRGVLLWNVWDQVPAARRLMAEAGPFAADDLKGRLPA
ncbi:MAG: NAD(P)/FAD-dependent oxidoreductase [Candidatus Promineifilaceae bacterium]